MILGMFKRTLFSGPTETDQDLEASAESRHAKKRRRQKQAMEELMDGIEKLQKEKRDLEIANQQLQKEKLDLEIINQKLRS